MKHKTFRFVTLVLTCALLFATFSPALASTNRASDYFSYTDVWATRLGNGKFAIEFDINSTHTMQQLGATKIVIWEQQNDGTYDSVKTFSSGLMDTNTTSAYGIVTYQGTSGVKYYATAALYAKNSSGSETLYSSTNIFTA